MSVASSKLPEAKDSLVHCYILMTNAVPGTQQKLKSHFIFSYIRE